MAQMMVRCIFSISLEAYEPLRGMSEAKRGRLARRSLIDQFSAVISRSTAAEFEEAKPVLDEVWLQMFLSPEIFQRIQQHAIARCGALLVHCSLQIRLLGANQNYPNH